MTGAYAVIKNGIVVNVVSWDGPDSTDSAWSPGEYDVVELPDNAGIGWLYSGGEFTAPPE